MVCRARVLDVFWWFSCCFPCDSRLGSKPGDRRWGCIAWAAVLKKLHATADGLLYLIFTPFLQKSLIPSSQLIRAIFGEMMSFDMLCCDVRVDKLSSKWIGLTMFSADDDDVFFGSKQCSVWLFLKHFSQDYITYCSFNATKKGKKSFFTMIFKSLWLKVWTSMSLS